LLLLFYLSFAGEIRVEIALTGYWSSHKFTCGIMFIKLLTLAGE